MCSCSYSTIKDNESVEFELELPVERMSRMASLVCSLVPPMVTHCLSLGHFGASTMDNTMSA